MITQSKVLATSIFVVSTVLIFLPLFFRLQLEAFKSLGLFGIFLINFFGSATLFLPAPAILSVGVGVEVYGALEVVLLSSIGSSLGEGVGFLFGYSSREVLNLKKHKLLYYLGDYFFKKYGDAIIVIFSFIPNPIVDGVGIIAGLASYSFKRFLMLVFIGRLLRNILIAVAVSYL
jgi:membrane protein YqaA with SNARE-associated domain